MNALHLSYFAGLVSGLALAAAAPLVAQVDVPNVFQADTTASASEVNENFEAMADRIETLEVFISSLQTHLDVTTDAQGNPAIKISGANLHINNGVGTTDSTNGTGNLIIGYDEPRDGTNNICSNGTYDDQVDCENNGGLWSVVHKSGSHNLVIGPRHNYSAYGGLIAGGENSVTAPSASVTGGSLNLAHSTFTSIAGGRSNEASGNHASVSGGQDNSASGSYATVSGGIVNEASGFYSAVSGGNDNLGSGRFSAVGGGHSCEADSQSGWAADGFGC